MTEELSDERRREAQETIDRMTDWATARGDIRTLLVVGSYAKGSATSASDIDLVVLTSEPHRYLEPVDWAREIGGEVTRTRHWGGITERRVRLRSGLELDIGFGHPSWASAAPLDAGTRRVLDDGFRVLLDRDEAMPAVAARLGPPSRGA